VSISEVELFQKKFTKRLFLLVYLLFFFFISSPLFAISVQWTYSTGDWIKFSSPALIDVNGDGDLEVVVGCLDKKVYVLDPLTGTPLPGWPQTTSAKIDSSPAVGDVDGDGLMEIVIGVGMDGIEGANENGAIYVFANNGALQFRLQTQDIFNVSTVGPPDGYADGVHATPSLGDIDQDGLPEIIIGSFDHFIYALNGEGLAKEVDTYGNLVRMNPSAPDFFYASVYRRDADNDGRWDEDPPGDRTPFAPGIEPEAPGYYGVDDDGDGLIDEGHPCDDDEDAFQPGDKVVNMSKVDEDNWDFPFDNTDTVWSSAAICDINKDGKLEFIVGGETTINNVGYGILRAFDGQANELPDFPGTILLSNCIWTGIVIGDIDLDGYGEIFCGTNIINGKFIYGFRYNNTEIRDGDSNPATKGVFATTTGIVLSTPALADLDGDKDLEIIAADFGIQGVQDGKVYAWHHNGDPVKGFPVTPTNSPGGIISSPVVGDIDGDRDPEILVGAGGALCAWHHNGSIVNGFPRGDHGLTWSTPAIGDIDNDGIVEIIVCTQGKNNSPPGLIICYEAGDYYQPTMQWPMFMNNPKRTGVYTPLFPHYAKIIANNLPDTMYAGEVRYNVTVTFKNIGIESWSSDKLIKLGAVGDSDPFYPGIRVPLPPNVVVNPGETYTFSISPFKAPDVGGNYVSDWQMLQEGVAWFPGKLTKYIDVSTNVLDELWSCYE